LFLLAPTLYTKADSGDVTDNVSTFEFEARRAFNETPDQTLTLLSDQFILVGCGSPDTQTVKEEWMTMLWRANRQSLTKTEAGLAANVANDLGSPCGGYVSGVFSGKAFVEIREGGFSINGRPIEETVARFQPLGQTISSIGGAALELRDKPIELWRSSGVDPALFGSPKVEVLFRGTTLRVLDQTDVREGDAVYVRSIHQALR
jgi:hypothetical protein